MINIQGSDNKLLCSFSGKLDTPDCLNWENDLKANLQEGKPVEFNMTGIEFVSSMFLRICIATAKQIGTQNFSIINVSPVVKKVYKIAGLDTILSVQ